MKSERDIENYLKRKCRGLCLKFTSPGTIGVPDRIIINQRGVFFVEVKASGKKPRKSQQILHKKFERLGHKVWVVDSYESVDRALLEMEGEIEAT
ncbi:VRR-NUC domain-containing protein [Streptococcus cuniculi]|uniref:VRR-NUC domain-containing protein n=1 Tax=Streptococcus cuniculi TaxID=1432788 RepID=A0A4Y9JDJ1_9STRE|nr:VRR-NUC domain-containing protein [Streptococcus cuniculi]MBF0778163.1 VRR-NUC domain-containing protein [Streptococcus cuniculi]TFU97905.1 VRR-NUC domain-containing protein [Streptococcus cuniculi]